MKLNQENLKFMLLINPFHWLDQNIKSPFLLPYIFYDVLSENLMAVKYSQVDIILFFSVPICLISIWNCREKSDFGLSLEGNKKLSAQEWLKRTNQENIIATFSWSPSNRVRKLAWVPVVPFTPLNLKSSQALVRFLRSIRRSDSQRLALFPTVVSWAGLKIKRWNYNPYNHLAPLLWQRANAQDVTLETLCNGQCTLST